MLLINEVMLYKIVLNRSPQKNCKKKSRRRIELLES